MRHRVKLQHFNRDTGARKAMFKNMLSSLFEHGAIETTEEKAKQIKRLADKLINRALPQTLNARRVLERFFGTKSIVNQIVDGIVPAMKERSSGFTRIIRLGRRRGDDASMVKIELVEQPVVKPEVVEAKKPKTEVKKAEAKSVEKKPAAKAKKPAAKKAPAKKSEK